jgi:hypothetical protein
MNLRLDLKDLDEGLFKTNLLRVLKPTFVWIFDLDEGLFNRSRLVVCSDNFGVRIFKRYEPAWSLFEGPYGHPFFLAPFDKF